MAKSPSYSSAMQLRFCYAISDLVTLCTLSLRPRNDQRASAATVVFTCKLTWKTYSERNQEFTLFSIDISYRKVSKVAKIRNRYNQVPHLTQDTNGKVTNSQKTPQLRAKRSALSQQVTTKFIETKFAVT